MSRSAAHRGERGVSAVVFALMLTALLGVSALAVDVGAAYTDRRHHQNTADAAVMSAAVESVLGGGVINEVVAEVRDKVNTTLGTTVSAAEWTACQDPDQLHHTTNELKTGNPTISPATDCISFSRAFDRVRVKLPLRESMGVFGPALGFGRLKTTAAAVAQIQAPGGIGAPPFVALSTATQGDFVCLRTSSSPQPQTLLDGRGPGTPPAPGLRADPCDSTVYDTSSENFGTLSPYRYLGGCTRQNADVEVAVSIGIDHIMGYFPKGYDPTSSDPVKKTERIDGGASCTTAFPNTFQIDTGFNAQGLRCALLSNKNTTDCNGVAPRFKQGPYVQDTHTFAGEAMDNTAPWDYLRPAETLWDEGAPDACVVLAASRASDPHTPGVNGDEPDAYVAPTAYDKWGVPTSTSTIAMAGINDSHWDHYDRYDAFTKCLEEWNPADDPVLFTEGLARSPRFAFIPKVAESSLSSVSHVHIESFLPTYMYRLYQDISGSGKNCDPLDPRASVEFYTHDAGQALGSCALSNQNVDRLSSIMLACGMVLDSLCNKDTGAPDFGGQDIYDFRLVE